MIIKEFLPNPVGSDKEGEYIKIFNDGVPQNLNGWQIKDAAGKSFNLSGELASGQELILPYFQTRISLNNNGEKLFLYDATGKLANELSYIGQASEGRVITKQQITTVNDKITTNGLTMDNNQLFNYQIANYPISRPLFIDFLITITGISL